MQTGQKEPILCTISEDRKLMYHPMTIQVSDASMKVSETQKKKTVRKITKLDYMEYGLEKFGSRAAIFHPNEAKLRLHTTYITKGDVQDAETLCKQVNAQICQSLKNKEQKSFKWLNWRCNVLSGSSGDSLSVVDILEAIKNKHAALRADDFICNLITQIPIQIARGSRNQFRLMFNGEDNQKPYRRAKNALDLQRTIRCGAYDALIASWKGRIRVVTSMGKQSTGKSYMLNHLFGTKFDISGGRCTDGGWLSAKIVDDILYVLCDFEGLGSFERSPQEDMLLATFNAAVSNCTIFKCDNRFDRTVEEMFKKFQSGVKFMAGSENCFEGKLLLVIKDVVDTGKEAAVADFKRHLLRLGKGAELVKDEKGVTTSTFFVNQMYSGLMLVPYPPLANAAFFSEMNNTLEKAINKTKIVHERGGLLFLSHIKTAMAKLNIGDPSAMSGEEIKSREHEIKTNLQNAVEAGAIVQPASSEDSEDRRTTFTVADDHNLVLMDHNETIEAKIDEITAKIRNYRQVLDAYAPFDGSVEETLHSMLNDVDDAGLVLDAPDSLSFLWDKQFVNRIPRTHGNYKECVDVYQLFLDLVYWRRELRVMAYIECNMRLFGDKGKQQTEGLVQIASTRLNKIRESLKICKSQCADCFYPCLLCKNHEDPQQADQPRAHSCGQTTHSCASPCEFCLDKGESAVCNSKCGHPGKHNCGSPEHTCGKTCHLSSFRGCNTKCMLEPNHDIDAKTDCKCAAYEHYCNEPCAVGCCNDFCREPHTNKDHTHHVCNQQVCPYKCEVWFWDASRGERAKCPVPCGCGDHEHELKMKSGECKDEGHTCGNEHRCPEICGAKGNCKVAVELEYEEKVLLLEGGRKIEYKASTTANASKLPCSTPIPAGKLKHEGDIHVCEMKDRHTCTERCDQCKYFCQETYGHDGKHDMNQHGNMKNTVFYAQEAEIDTGMVDGSSRTYRVGDEGTAEMCNLFCQRMGRGHVHLEYCKDRDFHEPHTRHETKKYLGGNESRPKDEVQHAKFWSRKNWKDPCLKEDIDIFGKCNYVCPHPIHEERAKKKEADDQKWCTKDLWHSGDHRFTCTESHPFTNAHIIFICDISLSMSWTDGGRSVPSQYSWLRDQPKLQNRLGCVYEAIHKFIVARRAAKNVTDLFSAVMFDNTAEIGARKTESYEDFVKDQLLEHVPKGGTRFIEGFKKAKELMDERETVFMFLTDGDDYDRGSAALLAELVKTRGEKFQLRIILFGGDCQGQNDVIDGIKEAGKGKIVKAEDGIELGSQFTEMAKQMNKGTFASFDKK